MESIVNPLPKRRGVFNVYSLRHDRSTTIFNEFTMNTTETQVKQASEGYSKKELPIVLWRYRGRKIPPSTLDYWLKQLRITPDETGEFSFEDVQTLIRLISELSRGKTMQQIKHKLTQEI